MVSFQAATLFHVAGGVEGRSAYFFAAILGDDGGFCVDELLVFQLQHVLTDSICAHFARTTDGVIAGAALIGLSVLDAGQVTVDGNRSVYQGLYVCRTVIASRKNGQRLTGAAQRSLSSGF